MSTRATGTFEITGWEQAAYEDSAEGPKLSRATVARVFRGGLTEESTAELLMAQSKSGDGLAYTALERVTGRLGGREGTFVLQHGAGGEEDAPGSLGYVVRGLRDGRAAGPARRGADHCGARRRARLRARLQLRVIPADGFSVLPGPAAAIRGAIYGRVWCER